MLHLAETLQEAQEIIRRACARLLPGWSGALTRIEDDSRACVTARWGDRVLMIDRFGPLPQEVELLLAIVAIKNLCRQANVEKVEAGPKGIVVAFRDRRFANPDGLVRYVAERGSFAKVRPDMSVVFIGDYEKPSQRLRETRRLMNDLARIAEKRKI
jgi:hypothetical protein